MFQFLYEMGPKPEQQRQYLPDIDPSTAMMPTPWAAAKYTQTTDPGREMIENIGRMARLTVGGRGKSVLEPPPTILMGSLVKCRWDTKLKGLFMMHNAEPSSFENEGWQTNCNACRVNPHNFARCSGQIKERK